MRNKKEKLTREIKKDLPYWLALNQVEGIGPKAFVQLIKKFGSAKAVWQAKEQELERVIEKRGIEGIRGARRKIDPEKLLAILEKKQIKVLTLLSQNYPKNLLKIYDPPPVIYYKGEILPADDQALAVVGSRRMTAYGREATERLVSQLVLANLTIVSGMARGIDGAAHQAALDMEGRTIAVLGCGVDVIYPFENRKLYEKIIEDNGAVISEFPPGTKPEPFHFPQRNRIIAGLALGVLVIEAAEKSGSLITANFAADLGREVFAVPGPINYPTAAGTANLIKTGAKLVTNVDDILEELKIKLDVRFKMEDVRKKKRFKTENLNLRIGSEEEKIILKILDTEPKHVDQIVRESKLPASKILATLSLMELSGLVKQLERGVFEIKN